MKITDNNFETAVQKAYPVLVDFYGDSCSPCQAIAPLLDKLAQEFTGEMEVLKVNIEDAPASAQKYTVRSLPTLILFDKGKVIAMRSGMASKNDLLKMINAVLEN